MNRQLGFFRPIVTFLHKGIDIETEFAIFINKLYLEVKIWVYYHGL